MEEAATMHFDYRMVPFPIAVALYMAEQLGGLPAKIMWSCLLMMVCFVVHIDLDIQMNRRRPGQKTKPRLPGYACAEPGGKKSPVKDTMFGDVLCKRLMENMSWLFVDFHAGLNFSGGSTAMVFFSAAGQPRQYDNRCG